MKIRIRPYNQSDYNSVRDLLHEATLSQISPGVQNTLRSQIFHACVIVWVLTVIAVWGFNLISIILSLSIAVAVAALCHIVTALFYIYGPPLYDVQYINDIYTPRRGGNFWVAVASLDDDADVIRNLQKERKVLKENEVNQDLCKEREQDEIIHNNTSVLSEVNGELIEERVKNGCPCKARNSKSNLKMTNKIACWDTHLSGSLFSCHCAIKKKTSEMIVGTVAIIDKEDLKNIQISITNLKSRQHKLSSGNTTVETSHINCSASLKNNDVKDFNTSLDNGESSSSKANNVSLNNLCKCSCSHSSECSNYMYLCNEDQINVKKSQCKILDEFSLSDNVCRGDYGSLTTSTEIIKSNLCNNGSQRNSGTYNASHTDSIDSNIYSKCQMNRNYNSPIPSNSLEYDDELTSKMDQKYMKGHTAQLRRMAVLKSFRRQGIASRLIDTAVAFSSDMGYDSVELITTEVHSNARKLYEKSGFQCIGYRPHSYLGGLVRIWMYEYQRWLK